MKRLFGAAALATVIALSPACGREQPKAAFNNRAPIVDTEKAARMGDEKPAKKELSQMVPTPVVPKKADAGVDTKLPAGWGLEGLEPRGPHGKPRKAPAQIH